MNKFRCTKCEDGVVTAKPKSSEFECGNCGRVFGSSTICGGSTLYPLTFLDLITDLNRLVQLSKIRLDREHIIHTLNMELSVVKISSEIQLIQISFLIHEWIHFSPIFQMFLRV